MERVHERVVEAQFGARAKAYVESAVHAQGADLEALERILRDLRPEHALDLGAGGGHVSYRLAPHAGMVSAVDLSPDMLAAVAATARRPARGAPGTEKRLSGGLHRCLLARACFARYASAGRRIVARYLPCAQLFGFGMGRCLDAIGLRRGRLPDLAVAHGFSGLDSAHVDAGGEPEGYPRPARGGLR